MPPFTADHQTIRDQLAQNVLDRIRNDEERSEDQQVRYLLAYFRAHLFDRGLEIKGALKACGIESNTFSTVFCAKLGEKPQQYFIARRLEVGHVLLLQSNISIYIVGLLIGYSSGQAFSQAFERAKGLRPKAYRAKYQKPDVPLDLDPELCEKITQLGHREAQRVQDVLQSRHPQLVGRKPRLRYRSGDDESYSLADRDVSNRTLDLLNAERFWSRIQGLGIAEQREKIFRERQSLALFELLKAKSLEESRVDRDRGLELAWLALDTAMMAEPLEGGRGCLQAIAWAWVGNEQRLQFNFIETERCFHIAELLLPKDAPFAYQSEILRLKANFKWFQGNLVYGERLAEEAASLAEATEDTVRLSKALIVRGILLAHLGRLEEASQQYHKVIRISGETRLSYVHMASFNLASCYWRQQKLERAAGVLKALKESLQLHRDHALWAYIKELEGRISLDERLLEQAISKLSEAKKEFHAIKSKYAYIVGINLAIAYFLSGETEKTFDLIGKALDIVKVWRFQPRFESIQKRLERSIPSRIITLEDMHELRDLCDEFSHTPQTRSLLGLKGMI